MDRQYLVLWHLCKNVRKGGLFSRLVGETGKKLQPIVHSFRTREVAENAYQTIKRVGGKPSLLRVIK